MKESENLYEELQRTQLELQISKEKYIDLYKKSEEALQNAKWRTESILEGTRVGTWEWNVVTGKLIINERWAQILGYTLEELAPISFQTWKMLLYPDDLKQALELLERHFTGEFAYYDCEYRMKGKTGNWVWIHDRGHVVTRTEDGKPLLMFGTHTDITERKKAEEALFDAHWRMASIIEGARIGTWEWNVQTGETVINERWAQIIGYKLDELLPMDFKKWEELVHPDDLKESDCQLRRHFSGELPYYDFECRIKHKDGSWVWIRDRGRVITRTSDGSPLMVFGTSSDIVERKQAEEALKLRESHLTAIIENQPGLVWLKDMEGRFLVVNTAFALSRGKKSPEEVVGLTESDLCPKKLAVKYKNEDAKVIKQKKSFRVEETVFDQERIKWFETFRRPIIDRTGQVIGTTGFKYFQGDKY